MPGGRPARLAVLLDFQKDVGPLHIDIEADRRAAGVTEGVGQFAGIGQLDSLLVNALIRDFACIQLKPHPG